MPMTTSQSPVAPLINLDFAVGALIDTSHRNARGHARASSLDARPVCHKVAAVPGASVRRRNLDPTQALAEWVWIIGGRDGLQQGAQREARRRARRADRHSARP